VLVVEDVDHRGAEAELLEAPVGGVDAVVRIPSARVGDLPHPAPAGV